MDGCPCGIRTWRIYSALLEREVTIKSPPDSDSVASETDGVMMGLSVCIERQLQTIKRYRDIDEPIAHFQVLKQPSATRFHFGLNG